MRVHQLVLKLVKFTQLSSCLLISQRYGLCALKETDTKAFYKIIKTQREPRSTQTPIITIERKSLETDADISNGLADNFEKLATPQDEPMFEDWFQQLIDRDVEILTHKFKDSGNQISPTRGSD